MAHDAATIARLSRVLADGEVDARALAARHAEIGNLLARPDLELSRTDLLVLGVNLHAYYTALETLLERVARLVDEEVPSGATWHRDLWSCKETRSTEAPSLLASLDFPGGEY